MSDEPLAERCYCLAPGIQSWVEHDDLATTLRWAFLREIDLDIYDPSVVATVIDAIVCPHGISTPGDRTGTPHSHAIFQVYGLLLPYDEDDEIPSCSICDSECGWHL